MNKKYKVAIVGATGAVGAELLKLLFKRNFPMESLTLLASSRSAGKEIKFEDKTFIVEEAKPECFSRFDIAIFSAGGTPSKLLVPECAKRGCIAIDHSSAFRMDPEVPLIVPEVKHQRHDRIMYRLFAQKLRPILRAIIAYDAKWHIRIARGLVFEANAGDPYVSILPSLCDIPLDLVDLTIRLIIRPRSLVLQLILRQHPPALKQKYIYNVRKHVIVGFKNLLRCILLRHFVTPLFIVSVGY